MLLVLVVLSPFVLAQERYNNSERERAVSEVGQQLADELRYELRKQSADGIRQIVRERRMQMEQETANITAMARQRAFQNQNEVRLAVHALLEMENLTGGIGPQIREVARNFNNSVKATLNAEERIEERGRIKRFFAGGNFDAADILDEQIAESRPRIQQLKKLRNECQCTDDVKALMTEQIQKMEQEQNRLQGLSQAERSRKGIFGWIWK